MVLTSSLGELMEDQMFQYYQIEFNINDRASTFIYKTKQPNYYLVPGC